MGALPEPVRRAAELSNQLAIKAKAGTLTYEDVTMAPAQVQMPPAQQPMPSGFQPQSAGPGIPGLGTPGFNPQPPPEPQRAQMQPQAAPQNVQPSAPPGDDPASEQRFRVLQGKYNAEVPRLHKQNQEQARQLEALQNQLNTTQAILAGMATPPQLAPTAPQQSLVTEKEVKEFGADLIDVVRRVAQEVVQPKIRTLEEQFRPVAQTVQQMAPVVQQTAENQGRTAAEVAHERMCNGLDMAFPTWEAVNASPEWLAWLDQLDPYTGQKRGAMLTQAYGSGDVTRVTNFFTGFMKEHAAVAPTGQQPTPTPAGQPQPGTPTVSLASLAAPGTGVGGPVNAGAPNESGQRVYTSAEVKAFYTDVQKGLYRGREADKLAIERELFTATKQGRVRP